MIRLCAVGQCAIELDGVRVTSESEIVFGLLLYLSARAGEQVPRDDIVAMFWPEMPHTRGRHCLRQTAYRLRQLGVPLRSDNGSLGVNESDVTPDFASLVADDATARTYAATTLGEILPAYAPVFSEAFATWVEDYRSRIAMRIRQGIVRVLVDLRSKGRYREAQPLARACLATDPFNEVATLTLAEATAVLSGNRAEAMAILDRYMDEVEGSADRRLTWSASVLRRRISERFVEQRYSAPPEPPFVGREDVLQLLVEKMQEAVTGRSTVVYLWGEPGIGKTRLLDELAKIAHVQGVHVERYNVSPNDPDRPLAAFSALLPRLLQMKGAIGISTEAFQSVHRFLDPSAWASAEPPRTAEEATQVFGMLKNGVGELFEVVLEEQPLCVCLDDVHWLDVRSVDVLAHVIERVSGRRLVLALTSHSATVLTHNANHGLLARAASRHLDPLTTGNVRLLVQAMIQDSHFEVSESLVGHIIDTSAGNPLFASELAAHFKWNGSKDALPHNLQTLLERRYESLSADGRIMLQACAVLGNQATAERLQRVLEWPSHHFIDVLGEVERGAMLSATEGRVFCRHELVRAEALRQLTPIARQALQARAAGALQRDALASLDGDACWQSFRLWMEVGRLDRALELVTRVGSQLLASGLAHEADDLLKSARTLLRDNAALIEVLPLQWRAARALGDLQRSHALATECQQLAEHAARLSDRIELAEFAAFENKRALQLVSGEPELDLNRLASSSEAPNVLAQLATRLIITADDRLEPRIAHKCYAIVRDRSIFPRSDRHARQRFDLVYHTHYGSLAIGEKIARQILIAEEKGSIDRSEASKILRWAHRPLFLNGRVDDALLALERSAQAALHCDSSYDELASMCLRAEILMSVGQIDEARVGLCSVRPKCGLADAATVHDGANALWALLQFVDGNPHTMRDALSSFKTYERPEAPRRAQWICDTLWVLYEALVHSEISSYRVARLRSIWDDAKAMGSADPAFFAISFGLLRAREMGLVSALVSDYLRHRREKPGISPALTQRVRAVLDAWTLPVPNAFGELLSTSRGDC